VAVSPDFATLVSGHQDGGVRFWERKSGNKVDTLPKLHSSGITCVGYSPGRVKDLHHRLLTLSRDNTLTLLDSLTHDVIQVKALMYMYSRRAWPPLRWGMHALRCLLQSHTSIECLAYV